LETGEGGTLTHEAPRAETAAGYVEKTLFGIIKKSNHNKREAMTTLFLTLAATLFAPLFITLGSGLWTGKVIPASLSILASFCTAWLQLRKPQQLWSLYRGAQREIEDQLTRYRFRIGEYDASDGPDRLLVEKVAAIALQLHYKWAPLVPNPEGLRSSAAITSTAESQLLEAK
jgi:hypothetical protein